MHSMFRQCIVAAALFFAVGSAWSGPRPLPDLELVDANEEVVFRSALSRNQPWVMVVVDASRTLASTHLLRLEKKEDSWNDALVIVVIGEPGALARLEKEHGKLAGVRWLRSTEANLIGKLELTGVPTYFAIDANDQIAWQRPANSDKAELVQGMLNRWIAPPVQEPQ